MARSITITTHAYRRTHGQHPGQVHGKGLWAFCLDNHAPVVVKYATYTEAVQWAPAQAQTTVAVLP